MTKKELTRLLGRADGAFMRGAYEEAMTYLSLATKADPLDERVSIGLLLCSLGMDSAEEAQAVYEFYQVASAVDSTHAASMARTLIDSIENYEVYGSAAELAERFRERTESAYAISYDEFRQLVDENDDFKSTFEKVIYSTRVVISDKGEFFSFIEELIDNGYIDMALAYIDSANSVFPSDLRLRELLDKIASKEPLETPGQK